MTSTFAPPQRAQPTQPAKATPAETATATLRLLSAEKTCLFESSEKKQRVREWEKGYLTHKAVGSHLSLCFFTEIKISVQTPKVTVVDEASTIGRAKRV